jgi:hypothetical protein
MDQVHISVLFVIYVWWWSIRRVGGGGCARFDCMFVCCSGCVVVMVVWCCVGSGSLCMPLVVFFSISALSFFLIVAMQVLRRLCGGILVGPVCGVFLGGRECREMWLFLCRVLFLGCTVFTCVTFRVFSYCVCARVLMRVSIGL